MRNRQSSMGVYCILQTPLMLGIFCMKIDRFISGINIGAKIIFWKSLCYISTNESFSFFFSFIFLINLNKGVIHIFHLMKNFYLIAILFIILYTSKQTQAIKNRLLRPTPQRKTPFQATIKAYNRDRTWSAWSAKRE